MSELSAWQEANDAYLAAAVEWLRLLLMRRAPAQSEPMIVGERRATPRETPAAKPWWAWRRGDPTPPPPPPPLALPPASFEVSEEQVADAARKMQRAAEHDPPPALLLLARRLRLSDFARNTLLLCAAIELDTRIAALCARVHDDPARPYPTFALAFALFEQPSWDTLSPDSPLRHWHLVEANLSTMQPLTTSALRADERIVNYIKGLAHLDERIAPFVIPMTDHVHAEDLPPSHRTIAEEIVRILERDHPNPRPIQLLGRDSESKELVAQAAAHELGLTLYRMAADLLPAQAADLETLT
ncbi:MAG TPA: ATP-binding protein, partial [Thermoanaerobaculia bacterium]|nr:ATP-binding protein [Thermoanaerobaculia bacterium]